MNYKVSKVVFTVPVVVPTGYLEQTLNADEATTLTRDGDTLVCEYRTGSGVEVTDYNWAIVAYSIRAADAPKSKK